MKTLTINDANTLKSIKDQFNKYFPHLKIEFFSVKHLKDEASPRTAIYDDKLLLSEVSATQNTMPFNFDGNMKTAEFEQNFSDMFGVNVQVYRKSGNIWLQTITTDAWTLAEQEEKGIQMT